MRSKLKFGAATAVLVMLGMAPTALAQDNDAPGDASTQGQLVVGQPLEAEIAPAGESDWYRLRVERGQRYALTLEGVAGADGATLDPTLGIHDRQGNQIAFNDDSGGSLNSALSYTPAESGEVFVEARAFSTEAVGRYRLNVTASTAPPDDVGNDASTRGRASAGRTVSGTIESEGDVDWYRLSARTSQRYRIALEGNGNSDSLADPYLRVIDSEGAEVAAADDSDGSLNAILEWTPPSNGTYFLEASGYGNAYVGGYTLNVTAAAAPRDDIGGDVRTRARLAVGGQTASSLDFGGDRDWYRINLAEGESYRFAMASAGDNALGDPLVVVRNASGEELAMDDDGGEGLNAYLEFTAPSTGAYFIEARGFMDDATGGYTLSALAGDIPGDTSTDVSMSADGDYRDGVLGVNGDSDWYRVELGEGQAIRIALSSAEAPDALGDPLVSVHGADGAELAVDDDGGDGLNAWLEFQAPAAGVYYVAARGFGDAAGRYALSITAGEIGSSADAAEYVMPNSEGRVSTISGPEDSDWFAVELIEGRPYRFYLDGMDPDPLADPMLRLFDAEGNEVAADDDGGGGVNSYVTYYSAKGGLHYAAASGYGGATGRYLLRVTDTDVPGGLATDEFLDGAGDDRVSRIDMPGDLDTYQAVLEAGVAYVIEVKGHGDNPVADPFLAVLNQNGERVTSDDDSGPGFDARLRFTPSEGGSFFLQASGLGGSTGWYQLSIVRQ